MLLELLRSLTPEDWEKQTVSPKWKVKEVAAHLLDTPLRGVSIARDGYSPEASRISPRPGSRCRRALRRKLGGRGKLLKLVRHGPGIHGTLAPPAADPAGGEQAGHHDPRTLLSRFGLLLAGPAVHLSHGLGKARNLRSDQRFR